MNAKAEQPTKKSIFLLGKTHSEINPNHVVHELNRMYREDNISEFHIPIIKDFEYVAVEIAYAICLMKWRNAVNFIDVSDRVAEYMQNVECPMINKSAAMNFCEMWEKACAGEPSKIFSHRVFLQHHSRYSINKYTIILTFNISSTPVDGVDITQTLNRFSKFDSRGISFFDVSENRSWVVDILNVIRW